MIVMVKYESKNKKRSALIQLVKARSWRVTLYESGNEVGSRMAGSLIHGQGISRGWCDYQ